MCMRNHLTAPLSARKWAIVTVCCAILPFGMAGQDVLPRQGGEYSIVGALPGDQTLPAVSLNSGGGYLVWEDNYTDEDGLGVSARRLGSTLSGEQVTFRVNEIGAGDQGRPQVAMLQNGGAVFVWQGGPRGFQDVFARFITPGGTFATGDIRVNTYTNDNQFNPVVTALADGSVMVVWASMEQDGSMQGIFGQRLSPDGEKLGEEFRVNGSTLYNQRTPVVAPMTDGGFVVAWVSDFVTSLSSTVTNTTSAGVLMSVHIHARLFDAAGQPRGSEFRVNNDTTRIQANPAITGLASGGFVAVWNRKEPVSDDSWDIYARSFDVDGQPLSDDLPVNTHTYGDQFAPKVASLGGQQAVVWTSLVQDGHEEGVFGRLLQNGVPAGEEFQVNTTTVSKQMQPVVAADGENRFLVAWTSFGGGVNSFDLYAQRFSSGSLPLTATGAPYVSALDSSSLSVTWAPVDGLPVAQYELFIDGLSTPVLVNSNYYVLSGLAPLSAHSVALSYRLNDGRESPRSAIAVGTTWSSDSNGDGLPDDWQTRYWRENPGKWPPPSEDTDGDGVSNLNEFLAGTNPVDPASVLRLWFGVTGAGRVLRWNTQPGFVYQLQNTTDIVHWTNLDLPRFAVGTMDSVPVDGSSVAAFYRVIRVR